MSRPSDDMTLEELREEYDWIYEFQSRMAERISGNPDVHNHADYVNRLEAENAELRRERDFYFQQVTENGERAHGAIDALNAENAKLRELVQELYEDQCDECDRWKYRDRMRELGVDA